jgi:thioredoxin reductase
MNGNNTFDVIIIGGSYAGLSAAMSLGRSLRKTLVIDSGKPCNASTPHSHNFITHDGRTPKEISLLARQQVEKYESVQFYNGLAIKGARKNNGFEITAQSGDVFECKKLIVASGIKDELPGIPGMEECWGKSVVHCPYCHGYEYRNRKTGIMGNGDIVYHFSTMVYNLTKELILFTNGKSLFTEEQNSKLKKNKISVIETELTEIKHVEGYLSEVILKDKSKIALDVLYVKAPFVQHSNIPISLGCELSESGHIKVDMFQKTTIPGVFACGDNCSPMRSVANAVSGGNFTGAMVNKELSEEQF